MHRTFLSFLHEKCGVNANHKLLVGVSGGVDSVVLCDLLYRIKQPFAIAHVNFKLRGDESDDDERFVQQLADKYHVTFFVEHADTEKYALENKKSIQLAARELRFNWFQQLCRTHAMDFIAIASHRDDSTETFFLNVMRGTGLEGLSGIKPHRENIIHPLLLYTKADIIAYAKKNDIKYREDSSNQTDDYIRNKIRHHVIPLLKELQPDISEKIEHLQNIALEHTQLLKKEVNQFLKNAYSKSAQHEIFKTKTADGERISEIVLYELLKPYGLEHKQVFQLHACLNHSGKQFLTKSHIIWVDRDNILVEKKRNQQETENSYLIPLESTLFEPFYISTKTIKNNPSLNLKDSQTVYLNAEKLVFPLILRKWKPGDVFQPFGMQGTKKMSDYLIDRKVSRLTKESTWVLQSGDQIVWVVGMDVGENVKVLKTSTQLIEIKAIK